MRQRRTYDGYVLMTRTEQSLLELHPAVNESREAAIDVSYTSPSDATPTGACQRGSGHPGGIGLTLRPSWSRRRRARAWSFVPAVPPTCHKQRS